MHLSIDIGKQCTDRATIDLGDLAQNIAVDLPQPQRGTEAIQSDRPRKGLRQPHIELPDERINLYIFKRNNFPHSSTYSSSHIIETPLPCAASENRTNLFTYKSLSP